MDKRISLYSHWKEVHYYRRLNRFVMEVDEDHRAVYLPNTGRMAEFRTTDAPFFTTPIATAQFTEKIVATRYQDSYVFLDTVKANKLFHLLLDAGCFPEFSGYKSLRREVQIATSRFDFLLEYPEQLPAVIEIKSCTLVHNGVAMFPDAPTSRGLRHIKDLDSLKNYRTFVVYLVLNARGASFFPNYHTDPLYGNAFLEAQHVQFRAFRVPFSDPVTCDPEAVKEIPISTEHVQKHCKDAGCYLLLLQNNVAQDIVVGALGKRHFVPGWYLYIGSGKRNLSARIARHMRKKKPKKWHIDYCTCGKMTIIQGYPVRTQSDLEQPLVSLFSAIAADSVPDFGASDSPLPSHFLYFPDDPRQMPQFWDILLAAMTDTLTRYHQSL